MFLREILTISQLSFGNEVSIRELKLTFMFDIEYNEQRQIFPEYNDDICYNAYEFFACY